MNFHEFMHIYLGKKIFKNEDNLVKPQFYLSFVW
jgi:hypothetical protein